MERVRWPAFIIVLALVGCATQAAPTPTPALGNATSRPGGSTGIAPGSDRVAGWTSDLEGLLPAMQAIHPDLYHGTSQSELEGAVTMLTQSVATADDDEVMVGVLKIVAAISAEGRDGHTGVFIWGKGTYPVHSLPLRLWTFSDGLYIVDALPPYEGLVGSRVDSVAGLKTADVVQALDPLIPRDNPETVTLLAPRYLLVPEVLHGLGLLNGVGPIELGIKDPAGVGRAATVEPIEMSAYNDWAGPYGLHLPPISDVLYLSRSEEPLWHAPIGETTLYVQYNRVDRLAPSRFEEIRVAAAQPAVRRVVVDLRHNYGGETYAYAPLLAVLTSPGISGKELYVITGRNTFSAASLFAAEVDRETDALFVGEPMGGSPNLYGNSRDVSLPYSRLVVSVATEYFVRSTPDDERLKIDPEIPTSLSAADYFAGRDPALEAILAR
jgi:hypothetical protein